MSANADHRSAKFEMSWDEGTEPSVEFNRRMRERVERTPTGLLVTAVPFLAIANAVLMVRGLFVKARCEALSR